MKDNLKHPCSECPFRKDSAAGWLGGLTAKQTSDLVLGEADFACHMTRHKTNDKMSRCKGSQLFLINHCKLPKINKPLAVALQQTKAEAHNLNDYLGFDFIPYHTFVNLKPIIMKKQRTQAEIARQIEGLLKMKQTLPEKSFFGDDNWAKIDAQINVLNGGKEPDDYYIDESSEEYEEGDNDIWSAATEAESWLDGNSDNDLFE